MERYGALKGKRPAERDEPAGPATKRTPPTFSKSWKDHYGTESVPLLSNKKGVHQLACKYCGWGSDVLALAGHPPSAQRRI
jgi:hypothetical protein